jgi:hypothetical protein
VGGVRVSEEARQKASRGRCRGWPRGSARRRRRADDPRPRAIAARVTALERADVRDVDHLQELLYGLSALVGVHFRKEEDLQLPVFDAAPPEVTRAVLERMEAAVPAGHRHAHG